MQLAPARGGFAQCCSHIGAYDELIKEVAFANPNVRDGTASEPWAPTCEYVHRAATIRMHRAKQLLTAAHKASKPVSIRFAQLKATSALVPVDDGDA